MYCLPGQLVQVRRPARRRSAGFSMVEILLAAMILSVGFIMLLPAFTVALTESRKSVESSIVVQLGQNAEAFCHTLLDTRLNESGVPRDPNFSNDHVSDGAMHVYEFNRNAGAATGAMPGFTTWRARDTGVVEATRPGDDGKPFTWGGNAYESRYERTNVRIYGDPRTSHYYWALCYRFPRGLAGDRSQVELWLMICRREEAGDDPGLPGGNMIGGLMQPTWVAVNASAGDESFSTSYADHLETGSGVVTNRGEILHISGRDGNTVRLSEPVQTSFTGVYFVKFEPGATEQNACISVVHTTVGH